MIKQKHINNDRNYSVTLDEFLKGNQDIEILNIINHKPYHTTIIYKVIDYEDELIQARMEIARLKDKLRKISNVL